MGALYAGPLFIQFLTRPLLFGRLVIMKRPKNYVTEKKAEYQAEIFANRLKKRYRHLARRFRRANIDVFRLYDRDIPEVRAVVDWYQGHLVVGEYIRLQTGPEWLPRMARAAGEALNIPKEKIFLKRRQTKNNTGARYKHTKKKGKRSSGQKTRSRLSVEGEGEAPAEPYFEERLGGSLALPL